MCVQYWLVTPSSEWKNSAKETLRVLCRVCIRCRSVPILIYADMGVLPSKRKWYVEGHQYSYFAKPNLKWKLATCLWREKGEISPVYLTELASPQSLPFLSEFVLWRSYYCVTVFPLNLMSCGCFSLHCVKDLFKKFCCGQTVHWTTDGRTHTGGAFTRKSPLMKPMIMKEKQVQYVLGNSGSHIL